MVVNFEAELRQSDPDRWLSSRFVADHAARADLVLLYRLDLELSRISRVARQPMMAEIRLTWWLDAVQTLAMGQSPKGHPLLEALAMSQLDFQGLVNLIEAHWADLDPLPDDPMALAIYLDATAGRVMHLAGERLCADLPADAVQFAARAHGLADLLTQGRVDSEQVTTFGIDLLLAKANQAVTPVAAFPALAHATLARVAWKRTRPSLLERQLRLTWAVARGRI